MVRSLLVVLLPFFIAQMSWGNVRVVESLTTEGPIEGRSWGGFEFYKNIPYAKPPVRDLRWKAPRKLSKRPTRLKFNNKDIACAQVGNFFATNDLNKLGRPMGREDCLYLHIWKPDTKQKDRPIFVWYHGGANVYGYASDPLYNGAALAKSLDAIVVSVNYRLGHFAGFVHSSLRTDGAQSKEDNSGNLITLDAIAALKWVRSNARYFGGDTDNITIGGESAGCFNVWGLILSPLAKDLFQKAYCMSGIPNNYPKFMAKDKANNFIEKALILRNKAFSMREAKAVRQKMTNEKIKKFLYSLGRSEILSIRTDLIPVHHIADGHVLPGNSVASVLNKRLNRVSLMTGTTKDEATYFYLASYLNLGMKGYWNLVSTQSGHEMLEKFNASAEYKSFAKDSRAATKIISEVVDYSLHASQFRLKNIYRFRFEWEPETPLWKNAFGSTHAFDLPLLFRNFRFDEPHFLSFLEKDLAHPQTKALADEFLLRFKGFVREGDPNYYLDKSAVKWPAWSSLPGVRPVNFVFANDELKTRYVFPNLTLSLDMFRVATSVMRLQD